MGRVLPAGRQEVIDDKWKKTKASGLHDRIDLFSHGADNLEDHSDEQANLSRDRCQQSGRPAGGPARAGEMDCSATKRSLSSPYSEIIEPGDDPSHKMMQQIRVHLISSKDPDFDGAEQTVYAHQDEYAGAGTSVGYFRYTLTSGEKIWAKFDSVYSVAGWDIGHGQVRWHPRGRPLPGHGDPRRRVQGDLRLLGGVLSATLCLAAAADTGGYCRSIAECLYAWIAAATAGVAVFTAEAGS
jgi:hypothetical protein